MSAEQPSSRLAPEHLSLPDHGGDEDLPQLIARLAEAEAALEGAMQGQIDAVVHGEGYSYLLHEAQLALVHSEARARDDAALLDAVIRSAPDLVLYVGADGTVRWANQAMPDFPAERLVGRHWLTFVATDQRGPMEAVFQRVIATGEPGSLDGPGPTAKGIDGWRSRRFGPVRRDGRVVGTVVVSRDVTDAKNAEIQLMISDRMASLGTLAAGMAHEINNPLAAAMGNLEVILENLLGHARRPATSADMVEIVEDALSATNRIRAVVRDLRMFSRSSDDDHRAVDLERVLESALRMARNETRHRAKVETHYGRVHAVLANESRLGQVFLNLIVNAAQAVPEGKADENIIRIATFETADRRVTVKISDTGPGIPPEVQKQMFTPFFTTKAIGIGTGLGLSICRRIVASMGGDISFRSDPGRGTEFYVTLPLAQAATDPIVDRAPVHETTAIRRGRILVVDDDIMVGATTAYMLEGDHDVVHVAGGQQALEMLGAGERFDVILCDLMMPQMSGMDFYAAVAAFDSSLLNILVFMTGGAFTERAATFLNTVRNCHIEKPFDLASLRTLVNQMIR
jgi:PAS domain S-box-containing protein